jgi:acyl-CoA dehydrogenase
MCRNHEVAHLTSIAPLTIDEHQGSLKHHQHSIVLVPIQTPGVEIVRNIPVVHHLAPEGHCEIVFRQVRIPKTSLLGEWSEGFKMSQLRLGPGRVHHCMRALGQCELALSMASERCLERETFGHHLSDYANVQEWLALSRIEIDQARLLVLQVAWLLDQAQTERSELMAKVAAIKVVAVRLQVKVVDRAMQIFGAMDGPDEVHLRTVARHELRQARLRMGASSNYFTTPEQMTRPVNIR